MQFLSSSVCVNSYVWVQHIDAEKVYREKARHELLKNATSCIDQVLEAISHEKTVVWPPILYL